MSITPAEESATNTRPEARSMATAPGSTSGVPGGASVKLDRNPWPVAATAREPHSVSSRPVIKRPILARRMADPHARFVMHTASPVIAHLSLSSKPRPALPSARWGHAVARPHSLIAAMP